MKRIGGDLLDKWKTEVAEKCGRTPQEISEFRLSAHDFNSNRAVVLSRPGDMECTFSHAFAVINRKAGKVAVFIEHCGYHEFYLSGIKVSVATGDLEKVPFIAGPSPQSKYWKASISL